LQWRAAGNEPWSTSTAGSHQNLLFDNVVPPDRRRRAAQYVSIAVADWAPIGFHVERQAGSRPAISTTWFRLRAVAVRRTTSRLQWRVGRRLGSMSTAVRQKILCPTTWFRLSAVAVRRKHVSIAVAGGAPIGFHVDGSSGRRSSVPQRGSGLSAVAARRSRLDCSGGWARIGFNVHGRQPSDPLFDTWFR